MDTKKSDDRSLCQALFDSTIMLLSEALKCTEQDDTFSIESVHRQRVIMKHLRSYQQLIHNMVPERSINFANQRVKKVNNLLSDRRDQDVLMKTHRKLCKKAKGKKTIKSFKALEKWLNELQSEEPSRMAWSKIRNPIKVEMAFWNRQLDKWPITADASLIAGLTATYSKARTRFKSAYADKDRKRYHDWRKWTKYLLYQLEFFSEHGKSKNRKHITALTKLGKLLGNHQDLEIFRKHIHQVSAHDFSSDQLARCDVLIRQIEKALEAQSKKIGNQWFKEKPSQFEKRMTGKYLSKGPTSVTVDSPDSST